MKDAIDKVKPIREILPIVKANLKSRGDKPELSLDYLPGLNGMIWGLRKKELIIIGGRTSQGKTSFSTQLAFEFADIHIPVLYLSLEETPEALLERIFCQVCKVNNKDLFMGKIMKDKEMQQKWITFEKEIMQDISLLITYGIGKDWKEINELISIIEPKPKVVIVDYVQAIAVKSEVSREMMNEYIRQFRQLAVEKDFAGILVSQINRGAEHVSSSEPYMWQLKNTGNLEEHADIVILLHWPNFYNHDKNYNEFKITIAKNRRGITGNYIVNYIPEFGIFEERMGQNLAETQLKG